MGIWALDLTDLVINIIIVIRLQLKMQNIKMCTYVFGLMDIAQCCQFYHLRFSAAPHWGQKI